MVGHWVVATDEGQKVVMVDGRAWKRGQASGGLADKARDLYGASHEEFIDNVKAFAYFPIAVARDVPNFTDGTITVKFKMIGGTLDRCAGILFNVKPNGDYLALRFNGTEDNLVLWKMVKGTRTFVKRGAKNVPLELGTWHEIKVVTKGTAVQGFLDGELLVDAEIVFAHLDNSRANQIFGPNNFVFTQQLLSVLDLAKAQERARERDQAASKDAESNNGQSHEFPGSQ